MLITTLRIDEIWHTVRELEPVRFGLPLPESMVFDPDELSLELAGRDLPIQTALLSRWSDGSARWVLIDFQADLDLRTPSEIHVLKRTQGTRICTECPIQIERLHDRLNIDTGKMTLAIPNSGVPRIGEIRTANGFGLARTDALTAAIRDHVLGEIDLHIAQVETVTAGPLVTEVILTAEGLAGRDHVLDLRLHLQFYAGKSWFHTWATILSRDKDLEIRLLRLLVAPNGRPVETAAHTGMKLARVNNTELLYNFAVDARNDPIWYEDSPEPCWVLWRGKNGGIMASVRNPDHHFPVRIAAFDGGIELDLHPESERPFHMYPWMAKTKEVLVSLVPPDRTGYELTLDSGLFQRPVRPVCSPKYYAACRAFGRIFPTSRKYYGLESLIATGLRQRPVGTGEMHYGDEPNLGYTYDDRGHGELVWTNGEYDTPRMLIMQYARTSNRSWFEAAEAAAWHWMDIDFIRRSPNPRWTGGIACHEGDHRVAAYAGPSHEWAEGLIDYYHLTGWREALEIAESVGDNVCRYIEDGEFDRVGTYALRELGWGLTTIAACLRATNKNRYRETGMRAVRILRRWADELGGFREAHNYNGPGATSELQPLTLQRDSFVSLTLNGLNRFYMASGEEEAKDLFLRETKAQLEWFQSPAGWAEQRETKLPNLEAFGYAYLYTGDYAYLEAGLQILDYALSNCTLRYYELGHAVMDESRNHPSTYRIQEVHAIHSQILGLALIPMFAFLEIAEEAGVLEKRLA